MVMTFSGFTSPDRVWQVASIVLGANKNSQVERNVRIDALAPLPEDLVKQIQKLSADRNDWFHPTGDLEHVPSPRQ
jgi:hypothetical protein